jgi:hypothetical protein
MKNPVFWNATPCDFCTNRASCLLQLLVTANVVVSSPSFSTLMMEAIRSSETSVFTRAAWSHIPEEGILILK